MDVVAAPQVLIGDVLSAPGWVAVADGRIEAAGPGAPPRPATIVLDDGVLSPGLVDIQVNGAFGHDLAAADERQWTEVTRELTKTGVTAFVPTITTSAWDDVLASLARYAAMRSRIDGAGVARSLGMHVEAVFLAPDRRGGHPAEHLGAPTRERVDELIVVGGDALAYVTLAPELDGGIAAVERLVAAGVRVSVGHSDATDDLVRDAADAGATLVTHLYNAQRPMLHRDPGVVGAALSDERLTLGLIADLEHVAPTALRVAFAAAGGRIALVSDAAAPLGMPAGTYHLGDQVVHVDERGTPRREDGALAGSALRMDDAVANTIACGIDPAVALLAATRVPADALGRGEIGRFEPGAVADLVWLGPDWRTRATWVSGELRSGSVS